MFYLFSLILLPFSSPNLFNFSFYFSKRWIYPFFFLVDPLGTQQYNDNNGNIYSDVFWLAALIESIGKLEFGQQVCEYITVYYINA